jgi:hypothetical protein
LAVAAGLVLVLGRNDALLEVASAAKQDRAYLDHEHRTFGGPLFGTPRAVEKLLKDTGGPLEPVRVPVVVAQLMPTAVEKPKPSTAPSAATKTAAITNPAVSSAAPSAPAKPDPHAAAPTNGALSGHVAEALLGQAPKPRVQPAAPKTVKTARKPTAKAKGPAGSNSYYDPLNGSL